jgi:hypothetical protein
MTRRLGRSLPSPAMIVALTALAGPPQNSQVSVASLPSNMNGVAICTEHNNGAEVDRGFHLIVFC